MEIHPPEKPIHTFKDFLLQLMTITAGILIALSLEGTLEWSHHRTLVSEAKENRRQFQSRSSRGFEYLSNVEGVARSLKDEYDGALR